MQKNYLKTLPGINIRHLDVMSDKASGITDNTVNIGSRYQTLLKVCRCQSFV